VPLTEAPGQGRLVDIGDTRLFVVDKAQEGEPLICLHGGPGFDHWIFGEYLDPLAQHLRLILVDLRGHGMSEGADPRTLTIAHMADDVYALADALELSRYAVLGHSFGGYVALRLAVDRPDGPAAVVLVDTAPSLRFSGVYEDRVGALPPELRERALRETSTDAELRDAVEAYIPLCFADIADPRIPDYLRSVAPGVIRREPGDALRSAGYDYELEERLDEVRARTLVVVGRRDRICPAEASELMARNIPGARLVVFERSGHMPFVEEQDAFCETVRSFVLER
jgi:proline iminopeptidase